MDIQNDLFWSLLTLENINICSVDFTGLVFRRHLMNAVTLHILMKIDCIELNVILMEEKDNFQLRM